MEDNPFHRAIEQLYPKAPAIGDFSAVADYLRSLEIPAKTTPTPLLPLSDLSSPTVERSVLDKLADATRRVRKFVSNGNLNRIYELEWVAKLLGLLRPIYGRKSPLILTLEELRKQISKRPLPSEEFASKVDQVEHFLFSLGAPAASGSFVVASHTSQIPATKDVFIIHGRDETNQLRLSKLIREDFNLTPVVLLDKPGRSAPTIDKFEHHAKTCSYAIALFTADDKVTTKSSEEYWQPRPNVIFETGWFVGRLGKERVLILLQEGVKIYSDFDGVNRIQFREDIDDKFRAIRAELEASRLIRNG
jgi:hypothetical protein